MTPAHQKTLRALAQVGIPAELANRLSTFRIGIYSDAASDRRGGRLIAEALGDVLGRLWKIVHATGPLAATFVQAANTASESCSGAVCAETAWAPPYGVVIAVGCPPPPSGESVRIGAEGWEATVGIDATVNDDPNPVGPAASAAITAGEVFRLAFADALGGRARRVRQPYRSNLLGLSGDDPGCADLQLNDCIFVGVGAVMHGLLWVVERWPAAVHGKAHLVDPDPYSASNPQRYAGMRREDIGKNKAYQFSERLKKKHPGLLVEGFPLSSNTYFGSGTAPRPRLAVVGVDSEEQRRQIALKLPRRTVNMWTEGARLGVGRHGIGDGWPCLFCVYPEDESGAADEVGQVHAATGIEPVRVRELLDTNCLLEDRDAAQITARAPGLQRVDIIGHPLRTVLGHLCAVINIPVAASANADVPLAFVSFLCGIIGFAQMTKEIAGVGEPETWQANGLKYPVVGNWTAAAPRPGCYLCGDATVRMLLRERFPEPSAGQGGAL